MGAAERMREVNRTPMSALGAQHHEENRKAALAQSEPEEFNLAWNKGRAMSVEEALSYALDCL